MYFGFARHYKAPRIRHFNEIPATNRINFSNFEGIRVRGTRRKYFTELVCIHTALLVGRYSIGGKLCDAFMLN